MSDAPPEGSRQRLARLGDRTSPALVVGYLLIGLMPYLLLEWIPTDEGLLGQTAERVLAGERPHRDFDDPYTGGLAMLHAAVFAVMGPSILATRVTLWAGSAALAGLVYLLARRVVSRAGASLAAVLALTLGVSRYFASMPSWYNAICALACLWALLRWGESRRSGWLVAAGAAAGVSMTFKVIGIYLVPAMLLAILHAEWATSRAVMSEDVDPSARGMFAFKALGLSAFLMTLTKLVSFRLDAADIWQFLVPAGLLSALLLEREWIEPAGPFLPRLRTLVGHGVLLILGLALPLIAFALPYGSDVGSLVHGVFVAPFSRLDGVTGPLPPLAESLLVTLPLAGMLWLGVSTGVVDRWDRRSAWLFVLLTIVAIAFAREPVVYQAGIRSLTALLPVAVGCALFAARRSDQGFEAVAVCAVAAMFAFVQVPYWHPNYSAYTMPLLVLVVLYAAVTGSRTGLPQPRRTLVVAGTGYLLLGALVQGPASDAFSRDRFVPSEERAPSLLGLPRARGLGVSPDEKRIYEQVIADVTAHSAPGDAIWAGPDAPEIYFLAERRNPTRFFYEILADPNTREKDILQAIEDADVSVIVINRTPDFSRFSADFARTLMARFPHAVDRQWYEVRWRQQ